MRYVIRCAEGYYAGIETEPVDADGHTVGMLQLGSPAEAIEFPLMIDAARVCRELNSAYEYKFELEDEDGRTVDPDATAIHADAEELEDIRLNRQADRMGVPRFPRGRTF